MQKTYSETSAGQMKKQQSLMRGQLEDLQDFEDPEELESPDPNQKQLNQSKE